MTEICPENLFRLVDEGDNDAIADVLDNRPDSLESCLLITYLIRRAYQYAETDEDLMETLIWAEQALIPHGDLRQLWAVDEVSQYEIAAGRADPELWASARAIAAADLIIN